MRSKAHTQKAKTPGWPPRGLLCLLALAMSIKPLADKVANYACCERHKETGEDFQATHLLPVASMEKGSGQIIAQINLSFNVEPPLGGSFSSLGAAGAPGGEDLSPARTPAIDLSGPQPRPGRRPRGGRLPGDARQRAAAWSCAIDSGMGGAGRSQRGRSPRNPS